MKTLSAIAFSAILHFGSFAQDKTAVLEDGTKVLLKADGTWSTISEDRPVLPVPLNCSQWVEYSVDKVTGESSISAKSKIIVSADKKSKGLGILLLVSERGTLIIHTKVIGAGSCIDQGAKANILFTDGSRLELNNDGKFNCDEEFTIYFGGPFGRLDQLEQLKTKRIETIRFWTENGYVQEDFTADNKEEFYQTINCITQ